MKDCKKIQSMITGYHNGILDSEQKKKIEDHVSKCQVCRKEFEQYGAMVDMIKARTRPQPSKSFNAMTWREIKQRKTEVLPEKVSLSEKITSIRIFKSIPAIPVLTAAGFLVAGLFLGWIIFSPSERKFSYTDGHTATAAEIQQIAYKTKAEELIDKSKVLIIGLANFDPTKEDVSVLNLKKGRELSEGYLKEAFFLNKKLDSTKQARLKKLVTDLEFILMQIASLENEDDLNSVEIIKQGIDGRGILLKLNLEEIDRINASSRNTDRLHKNVI